MSPSPPVDLGRGLVMPNPVGLASGTAGYGHELRRLLDLDRLGALFTKGTTERPREGNRPPRIAETPAGMLNSIGLQNPGVDHVADRYAPLFRSWRIPVVVNVAGSTIDEYVRCARRLEEAEGIAGLELNISCPNIAHGLDLGRDPAGAARVTEAVRAMTARCVVVKLSPNVTDIAAVARAVASAGADAVSAVNTYLGMVVAPTDGGRSPRRPLVGGLSGPAIRPLALAAVAAVAEAVSVPVIGVGGISTASDAAELLAAGADAVQVGTASFADPWAALDILEGLEGLRPPVPVPPVGVEPTSTG